MTEIFELVNHLAPQVESPTTEQIERQRSRLAALIRSEQVSQELSTSSDSAGSAEALSTKDAESGTGREDVEVAPVPHDTQTHRRTTKRLRSRRPRAGHRHSKLFACAVAALVLIGASVFALQQKGGVNSRTRSTNKSVASLTWSLVSESHCCVAYEFAELLRRGLPDVPLGERLLLGRPRRV